MTRIGPTQLTILAMVGDGRQRGRSPTIREMQKRLGFASMNAVHYHLLALRAAGLLTWECGCAATLTPTFEFIPADELVA